jgi:hypothetical protein
MTSSQFIYTGTEVLISACMTPTVFWDVIEVRQKFADVFEE